MKATVLGAAVSEAALRAAMTRADIPTGELRVINSRAWVELPVDLNDGMIARLAKELAVTLHLISVESPGLHATRSTHAGVEDDISADARKIAGERGFPDDVAPREVAWALIEHASEDKQPPQDREWAKALLERMVADGSVELRGTQPPIDEIASVLRYAGRDVEDWLASRLLDKLINSQAIDEVFVDTTELAAVARQTRPRR